MKQDENQADRLYVRSSTGRYAVATADRVVEAACAVAEQRIQRGQAFSDPTLAGWSSTRFGATLRPSSWRTTIRQDQQSHRQQTGR